MRAGQLARKKDLARDVEEQIALMVGDDDLAAFDAMCPLENADLARGGFQNTFILAAQQLLQQPWVDAFFAVRVWTGLIWGNADGGVRRPRCSRVGTR